MFLDKPILNSYFGYLKNEQMLNKFRLPKIVKLFAWVFPG